MSCQGCCEYGHAVTSRKVTLLLPARISSINPGRTVMDATEYWRWRMEVPLLWRPFRAHYEIQAHPVQQQANWGPSVCLYFIGKSKPKMARYC